MAKTASQQSGGFNALIGLNMSERGDGTSRCTLDVGPDLMNPHGVVHGGAIYSMVDNGMGAAVYTKMDDSESCATIEIKIVYLAPVLSGTLVCDTTVINKGRRVAALESEVRNGDRLVAKALGTFAIFPQR
jgi:acyl-CoA thioesterase